MTIKTFAMLYEPAVLHNSERKVLTLYFGTKEKWIGTLSTIRNTPMTVTDAEKNVIMLPIGQNFVLICLIAFLQIKKSLLKKN